MNPPANTHSSGSNSALPVYTHVSDPAGRCYMPKLFISYRRQDAGAEACLIAECLRERYGERNVFIDVDNIPRGVDFVEAIQREVGSSDVLLAVIGKDWLRVTDK